MKKWRVILAGLFLALICALGTPGWTMEAMAASAAISFSDPQVKTGDSFSVNVKIASADGNIGKTDLMLKYDDKALQFSEGADASGGAGSVHLSASTDSSSAKTVTYTLKFKALAEGSTKITVTSSEIYDTDSKEIKVSKTGSSTVTVTSGTGSTDSSSAAKESGGASGANAALSTQTVEVNGTSYTVAQSFDKKALPDGFSEGSIEYKDASVECAAAGEMTLLYLVDGDGNGSFFIYDASSDTFSSFITINVGIFNLLPIPALDGARIVFLLVEAIRRKPVPPEREGMVHLAGMALLMLLMIAVTAQDILRLIQGG